MWTLSTQLESEMGPNFKKSEVKRRLSQSGSVDVTPTWVGTLPLLLAVITDGTPEGQAAARGELLRMAQIADLHIAALKERA
jgi:hypothetical protein